MVHDPGRLLPDQRDWAAMRAGFHWPRPQRFNIARACCDAWAEAEAAGRAPSERIDQGRPPTAP